LTHTPFEILTILGAKYLIILAICIAGVWFFKQSRIKQKEIVVFGIITGIVSLVIARFIAYFYFDPRPFTVNHVVPLIPHESDNGFPSDHVLLASVITIVIVFFNKKLGLVLAMLTLIIGISRVISGIHNFLDIFGSMIIVGLAVGTAYTLILPRIKKLNIYNKYFIK